MKILVLTIFFICWGTITSFSQNLNTEATGTTIAFQIQNLGRNVDGSFSEFTLSANFEKNDLDNSYFSGTAKIQSINTGNKKRDKSLQKAKYFDSEKFTELRLASSKITKLESNRYEFYGELSIKGTTKKITFPFTIEELPNQIRVKGSFEVNRLDFNVGESSWILSKNVKVSITYLGNFN